MLHHGPMSDNNGEGTSRSGSGYMTGIVIGMMVGSVLGLLIFDNIALGFGVGLPIGIAIGMMGQSRRKPRGTPAEDA